MVTLVCLVFWMFAFKYYELALKLDKHLGGAKNENCCKARNLNRVMLINIFFWPAIEQIFYLIINFNRSVETPLAVYIIGSIIGLVQLFPLPISCVVTYLAFNKITRVTKDSAFETKPHMMYLNIAAQALASLSAILLFISIFSRSEALTNTMYIMMALVGLAD